MFTLAELILIVCLGHDKFAIRQGAQKSLQAYMSRSLCFRLQFFSTHDLETRSRLQTVKQKYEQFLVAEYEKALKGYKGYPYIDSLDDDYTWNGKSKSEIIRMFMQPCYEPGPWRSYSKATERWFFARRFEDPKVLRKDLEMLKKGDDAWWKRQGKPNPMRE